LGHALIGVGGAAFVGVPLAYLVVPKDSRFSFTAALPLTIMAVGAAVMLAGFCLHFGWPRRRDIAMGMAYVRHPRRVLAAVAKRSPIGWRGFPAKRSLRSGWVSPDLLESATEVPADEPQEPTPSWEELNRVRVGRYEENRGLFLVHEWWTPSQEPEQVADVTIRLKQHQEGPLSRGEIRAVEYTLGPRFTDHSLVRMDPTDDYAIHVPMWDTMLCLAKVYFTDGSPPLLLERYVNFDAEPDEVPTTFPEGQSQTAT